MRSKKYLKYILLTIWSIYSIIGISNNYKKYRLLDWIIVLTVFLLPIIIGYLISKRKVEKVSLSEIALTLDNMHLEEEKLTPSYVIDNNMIYKTDNSKIKDEEIPYLIELGSKRTLIEEQQSRNPKFHRTEKEDELSFNFSQKHTNKLAKLEDELYDAADSIGKITKKWIKSSTKIDIQQAINRCDIASSKYENLKQFCYKKSKGGMIYFQDMWEYCHNSKNPCFSYIDSTIELKNQLREVLKTK